MRFRRPIIGLVVLVAALAAGGRSTGAEELEPTLLPPHPGRAEWSGPTGPAPLSEVGAKPGEASSPGGDRTPATALVPVTETKAENSAAPSAVEVPAFRLVKPRPPSLGTPQGVAPPNIIQVSKPVPLDLPRNLGPALAVEKITPAVMASDKIVSYEIVVRNTGSSPAFHVCLEDLLPPGTTFQGSIPLAENFNGRLFWDLGRIDPGAHRRCKIEIQGAKPMAAWPTVQVRFATGPALPPPPSGAAPVRQVAAQSVPAGKAEVVARPARSGTPSEPTGPVLELKTGGPAHAAVGEKVVLQMEIHNPGSSPVTQIVLHVNLSAGLDHPEGHEIEATLKGVSPGKTLRIKLPVQAVRAGWQLNQAWITQGTKVLAKAKTTVLVGKGGGLQVKQTAPQQTWRDREVECRVEVRNGGTAPAANVRVNDFLPLGLEFIAAGEGGAYDQLTRIITWQLGTIPAGQARWLTIQFRARTAGDWTNRVVAQVPGGSPASAEANLTVSGLAALVLEVKAAEPQVEVGEETVYEIRVLNRGIQAATGIELVTALPTGLQPLNAEGPEPFRLQERQVIFDPLPRLDAGAEVHFRLRVRCQTPGDMRLQARLTSAQQPVPILQEESTRVR